MNVLNGAGAVVTGAASGIGNAIATAFIEAGAGVLLCDVQADALEAAADRLGERAIGRWRRGRSATPPCSSRPTRPGRSPATRWPSTAAR
jgi:NAD(P)-dependent dehydrogenase (short-subunit alcohol dehydrogenase family)